MPTPTKYKILDPKAQTITVRVSAEVNADIQRAAAQASKVKSDWLRDVLLNALEASKNAAP